MSEFDRMSRPGGTGGTRWPIRPTGLGYRAVSTMFLSMGLFAAMMGLLIIMSAPTSMGVSIVFMVAGWFVVTGIVLRVVSDFLAALAEIARAVRELG